jgi:hypothetical protein
MGAASCREERGEKPGEAGSDDHQIPHDTAPSSRRPSSSR